VDATDYGYGWGGVVIIEHYVPGAGDKGYVYITSMYAHLDSMYVSSGDTVTKGDQVGDIGTGGGAYTSGPHLHFEMRTDETLGVGSGYGCTSKSLAGRFDPWDFIDSHRVWKSKKASVELASFEGTAQEEGNLLSWTAGDESANAGWNLLRSGTRDGEYRYVNDDMIPPQQQTYSLLDDDVSDNTVYYYQLEDFDVEGRAETNGPIRVINTTADIDGNNRLDGLDLILLGATTGADDQSADRWSILSEHFGALLNGSLE